MLKGRMDIQGQVASPVRWWASFGVLRLFRRDLVVHRVKRKLRVARNGAGGLDGSASSVENGVVEIGSEEE